MDEFNGEGLSRADVGRQGEEEAAQYLRARGWTLLARNFRWRRNEVDIIASKGRILAFVEVKCRRSHRYGHPLEAITRMKQQEVTRVARGWLQKNPLPPGTLLRFDAIGVSWRKGSRVEVLHVPDAWRLGR
jgi:putative endonuclease